MRATLGVVVFLGALGAVHCSSTCEDLRAIIGLEGVQLVQSSLRWSSGV